MSRIPDNCRLFHGPYRPPRCQLGKRPRCRIRGRVVVKRISAGPIPWPQTIVGHVRAFILCGDLVLAVRRESEVAVAFWGGVTRQTVWVWRRAVGGGATTEGTSRLRSESFSGLWAEEAREKAWGKARDPEQCEKIAAAKRGMPTPLHVIEAMRQGRTGKPHSAEARLKMREAQRRRGTRPPAAGKAWEPWEEALLGKVSDAEVARRMGRKQSAVKSWRQKLQIRGT